MAAGQQAYVVCPLIDETDEGANLDDVPPNVQTQTKLHSALATYQALRRGVFRFAHWHFDGTYELCRKDEVMEKFAQGIWTSWFQQPSLKLVLTYQMQPSCSSITRIVLVWQPAPTERSRRRGSLPGKVFLNSDAKRGTPARRRLAALEATADGFKLAELDLSFVVRERRWGIGSPVTQRSRLRICMEMPILLRSHTTTRSPLSARS